MSTANTVAQSPAETGTHDLASAARDLAESANQLAIQAQNALPVDTAAVATHGDNSLITGFTVFILACFVGYFVVWRVTPALHSPLMAVTNAISSVIIVGALLAVGASAVGFSKFMGFMAVVLASINIFGGFIVTRRMLHMFKKKG